MVRRLFFRLGHLRWFPTLARTVGYRIDIAIYRLTRGRLTMTGTVAPILLLTTTGRRTGEPRTTPVIYVRDGEAFIVTSQGESPTKQAAWPLNLIAEPSATVELGGRAIPCRARRLSEDEVERHWPALLEVWPAHATYLDRSGIRTTFRLEPIR